MRSVFLNGKRVIFLIDGEHQVAVTTAAVAHYVKKYSIAYVGCVFAGGYEKVQFGAAINILGKLANFAENKRKIIDALTSEDADIVVDLSDEPILTSKERLEIAAGCLATGVSYLAGETLFSAPVFEKWSTHPSIGIFGTGKRIGKTAVGVWFVRQLMNRNLRPVVVSMGRGGPETPELARQNVDEDYLLDLVDSGRHAASDYLENAFFNDVPAIGTRRCGGGFFGAIAYHGLEDAINLANDVESDIAVIEGSGASLIPHRNDANLLIVGLRKGMGDLFGYTTPLRILLADAILVTLTGTDGESDELEKFRAYVNGIKPELRIWSAHLTPQSRRSWKGLRALVVTTHRIDSGLLRDELELEQVEVHATLGNRAQTTELLQNRAREFDVILTELKSSGVDTVLRMCRKLGVSCDFLHYDLRFSDRDGKSGPETLVRQLLEKSCVGDL